MFSDRAVTLYQIGCHVGRLRLSTRRTDGLRSRPVHCGSAAAARISDARRRHSWGAEEEAQSHLQEADKVLQAVSPSRTVASPVVVDAAPRQDFDLRRRPGQTGALVGWLRASRLCDSARSLLTRAKTPAFSLAWARLPFVPLRSRRPQVSITGSGNRRQQRPGGSRRSVSLRLHDRLRRRLHLFQESLEINPASF